jgi:hypothetical protein
MNQNAAAALRILIQLTLAFSICCAGAMLLSLATHDAHVHRTGKELDVARMEKLTMVSAFWSEPVESEGVIPRPVKIAAVIIAICLRIGIRHLLWTMVVVASSRGAQAVETRQPSSYVEVGSYLHDVVSTRSSVSPYAHGAPLPSMPS